MPWAKMQANYRSGRGFLGGLGFVGPSQAPPAAATKSTGPAPDPRAARRQARAAERQRRNEPERQERMATWRKQQHVEHRATGQYGFKRFWEGRPELMGTNPYDHDWLSIDRPAIHEGSGPIGGKSRLGDYIERETGAHAYANQAEEAEGPPPMPSGSPGSAMVGGPSSPFPRGVPLRKGSQLKPFGM